MNCTMIYKSHARTHTQGEIQGDRTDVGARFHWQLIKIESSNMFKRENKVLLNNSSMMCDSFVCACTALTTLVDYVHNFAKKILQQCFISIENGEENL